jgi:hypothetical protein
VTRLDLPAFPGCPSDPDGLCPLDAFVDGLKKRIEETDWEWACKGDWAVDDPEAWVSFIGDPPTKPAKK